MYLTQMGVPVNLFEFRSSDSLLVNYKETAQENLQPISEIYREAGLTEKIISVEQPKGSAEINSQNFKITRESGESVILRRCHRLQGKEKYQSLNRLFTLLKNDGVRVPEFYPDISIENIPYFERESSDKKVCWVFYKYINAESYFSGKKEELFDAADQIGKMHACLKKNYPGEMMNPLNSTELESYDKPLFSATEWQDYFKIIEKRIGNGEDQYDKLFIENKELIEKGLVFVESNFTLLDNREDIQCIHYELNSSNLLVDKDRNVVIMDFDDLKPGNIYTDIGLAFHRLLTTCLERGEADIPALVDAFVTGYKQGNPSIDFDLQKVIVAMHNRALRSLKFDLRLKFDEKREDWLPAIPTNIKRLKQVMFLAEAVK